MRSGAYILGMNTRKTHVLALTVLAILAFAGNSLLTRMALATPSISPAQFTGIRLLAGAVILALLCMRHPASIVPRRSDLGGVASLFVYAAAFTFAYVELGAATGALILFAVVQLTLAGLATIKGNRPGGMDVLGILMAFSGVVWLLAPGAVAPPFLPALLMITAGFAWGVYTMLGRGAADPLALTARNFIGASAPGLLLLVLLPSGMPDLQGVMLAILSGAITSALGYVIWYLALPNLSVATAGGAQLLVPVVAAIGASLWLGETLTPRLIGATLLVLGGVGLTLVTARKRGP